MTKVNENLKALARQIAQELNKKDGSTADNRITAKHWNVFAADKGGKSIGKYIEIPRAELSIYTYLKRNANSNKEREDLGAKWLNQLAEITEVEEKKSPGTINKVPEVIVTSNKKAATNGIELTENIDMPDISSIELPVSATVAKPDVSNMPTFNPTTFAAALKADLNPKIDILIKDEIKKRGLDEDKVDIRYWEEKIQRVSTRFHIPEEILVAIISKETRFRKNLSGSNGKGAMQLTGIAIRSFFPGASGSWFDLYKQMDSKLLEDILYKKDMFGKLIMKNNKPVLKYNNWNELLTACGKDDELSIKVGSLIFEMKYVEAVATEKFGRSTWANIPQAIEKLQSGEFELGENTNRRCISQAIRNYNGNNARIRIRGTVMAVKDDYQRDVMDSLRNHGFDFAEPIIRKS